MIMNRTAEFILMVAFAVAHGITDCGDNVSCIELHEEDDVDFLGLEEEAVEAFIERGVSVTDAYPRRRYIPSYPRRRYSPYNPSFSRRRYVPSNNYSGGGQQIPALFVLIGLSVLVVIARVCCWLNQEDPIVREPLVSGNCGCAQVVTMSRYVYRDGAILRNHDGANVCLGSMRGFTSTFYCGRYLGKHAIPDSDGRCGSTNGPQCASCNQLQPVASRPGCGDVDYNDEGTLVHVGSAPGFTKTLYCGRAAAIPNSDGYCGPTNGPQCMSCNRFQAFKVASFLATKASAEVVPAGVILAQVVPDEVAAGRQLAGGGPALIVTDRAGAICPAQAVYHGEAVASVV